MTFIRTGAGSAPKYELLSGQHQVSGNTLTFTVPGSTLLNVGDQLKFWGTYGGVADESLLFTWGALLYGAPAIDVGSQGSFEGVIQKTAFNKQHCSFKMSGRLAAFTGSGVGITVDATRPEAAANNLTVARGGGQAVLSLNVAIIRA